MIGIYKITNKLNGKSYIGQSIHCGKRLDEHCKGDQFIDEMIQFEGIENFTFEILKEASRSELSFWEDYYILKYDTFYPNGYNKRWNCSEEMRQKIQKRLSEDILDERKKSDDIFLNYENNIYTRKYIKFYFYLVCLSDFNAKFTGTKVFKQRDILPNKIKEKLKLDPKTIKKYLYQLEKDKMISYNGKTKIETIDVNEIKDEIKQEIKKNKIEILTEKAFETEVINRACIQLWNIRNKSEKQAEYYIKLPEWSIPEKTLFFLNEENKCSELELKLYFLCNNYNNKKNEDFYFLTFKEIKEILQIKHTGSNSNKDIREALLFLKNLGLINFIEILTPNIHGKNIPCFKVQEVKYYNQ